MGLFDRSSSTVQNISETENTQRNVNIQDAAGAIAISDTAGNVQVLQTDFNAIGRATDLAAMSVEASSRLGELGLSYGLRQSEIVADSARESVISSENFLDASLNFAREANTKFQATIASTVDAIQRIGVEQNKSTDQRLSEVSERTTKYALIAIGVLGLALVGFAAFKR